MKLNLITVLETLVLMPGYLKRKAPVQARVDLSPMKITKANCCADTTKKAIVKEVLSVNSHTMKACGDDVRNPGEGKCGMRECEGQRGLQDRGRKLHYPYLHIFVKLY